MNIVLSSDLVRILFLGPRMKPRMCHWETPKKLEAPVYKYFSDDIKVIKSRLCDMKKKNTYCAKRSHRNARAEI